MRVTPLAMERLQKTKKVPQKCEKDRKKSERDPAPQSPETIILRQKARSNPEWAIPGMLWQKSHIARRYRNLAGFLALAPELRRGRVGNHSN